MAKARTLLVSLTLSISALALLFLYFSNQANQAIVANNVRDNLYLGLVRSINSSQDLSNVDLSTVNAELEGNNFEDGDVNVNVNINDATKLQDNSTPRDSKDLLQQTQILGYDGLQTFSCSAYFQYASVNMSIPTPVWPTDVRLHAPEASIIMAGHDLDTMRQFHAKDRHPIPDTKARNGYMGDRHFEFWRSGLELYLLQKYVLKLHDVDISNPPAHLLPFRMLDFGGSTGRLSRHWHIHEPTIEVITSDTNVQAVGFICMLGLGKAFHNDFVPPLAIQSNSVSFFTALSVWTHMSPAVAISWFKEVRRVLKPGGYAWITIMGDHTWSRLHHNKEKDLLYKHIIGGAEKLVPDRGFPKNFTAKDLAKHPRMPYPFTYFMAEWHWPYKPGVVGEFYLNSFITYEFIRREVSSILEVVDIYPQNSLVPPDKWHCPTPECRPTRTTGQDVLLLRKPLES